MSIDFLCFSDFLRFCQMFRRLMWSSQRGEFAWTTFSIGLFRRCVWNCHKLEIRKWYLLSIWKFDDQFFPLMAINGTTKTRKKLPTGLVSANTGHFRKSLAKFLYGHAMAWHFYFSSRVPTNLNVILFYRVAPICTWNPNDPCFGRGWPSQIEVIGVLGISWVWPPPSNSGKWRFSYGIPKSKDVVILVVTIASWEGGHTESAWIF